MNKLKGQLTKPDQYLHVGVFPLPRIDRVPIDGAPEFMGGLRALLISDVHLRRFVKDPKLNRLIDMIAGTKADMLLLAGDYGEGTDQCVRFFQALSRVRFPLGIYAAVGNNDEEILAEHYEVASVQLLRNRRVELPVKGGILEIAANDDYEYGHPETEHLFTDARDHYRLLLSHHPVLPKCSPDLMLCGHTHGGQINLFGATPYTLGFESEFDLIAVRGMHRFGDIQLYVCNGIGVSRLPLRLGAAPQMAIIEF